METKTSEQETVSNGRTIKTTTTQNRPGDVIQVATGARRKETETKRQAHLTQCASANKGTIKGEQRTTKPNSSLSS